MTPPRLHGDTQLHTQRPQQRGCFVNSVLIPGARNLLCQPAKPGPCNIQGFLVHRKCTNIWSISGIALVEGLEASFLLTRFQGAGHVNSKYFKLDPAKSCLEQQRLPRVRTWVCLPSRCLCSHHLSSHYQRSGGMIISSDLCTFNRIRSTKQGSKQTHVCFCPLNPFVPVRAESVPK